MEKPEKMIPLFQVYMHPGVGEKVEKTLMSGYIGQGPEVDKFEDLLKDVFQTPYVVTVNSATSATHLAFSMICRQEPGPDWKGISPGDEVLTTPLTCTATNWPALANGLNIKWVDVDPETCNMDLGDLENKITEKTKVILAVHWGGYPNDIDRIKSIIENCYKKYGFRPKLIEDCAHSFGSEYKGSPVGTTDYAFYSFQAIKHFTTVDGGVLILPNEEEYRRAKLLRWYGIDRESNRKDFRCEDDIPEWGFKFHMNDVNAVIGMHNLQNAKNIVDKHVDNAKFYDKSLKNVPGLTLMKRHNDYKSAFWIYTVRVDNQEKFMQKMKECNIMVSRVHERNDKHSCVQAFRSELPQLDKLVGEMICIPVGWWVTREQQQYIVDCIKEGWQ